jgi:hypothetical protein
MFAALLLTIAGHLAVAPIDTTVNGVTFPSTVTAGSQTLVLNGVALRKKAIFKVYQAGLYLTAKSSNADSILAADATRRMVMQFLRDVGKDKMCEAWNDELKDNTPNASAQLKTDFTTLCGLMVDMKEKDQMVFTYVPGTGTEVSEGGAVKGTIAGKEFADALFKAWIGPKPGPGEGFKKDLLGAK